MNLSFIKKLGEQINQSICSIPVNTPISVKRLRRILGISPKDRSWIVFASNYLANLEEQGFLKIVNDNSPRTYLPIRVKNKREIIC
jgi:hypothetical protein